MSRDTNQRDGDGCIGRGNRMTDLADVVSALDAVRYEVSERLIEVLSELKEANRELGGFEGYEGIGSRVHGIEIEMERAREHLDNILVAVQAINKDQMTCYQILDEVQAISNEVKKSRHDQEELQTKSSQAQSSHLSGLYFLVIVGIVLIVGTLRHWF